MQHKIYKNRIGVTEGQPGKQYALMVAPSAYLLSSCVSACLSVCVSVTLWYCIKIAKRTITPIMPYDSPGTGFLVPKITAKFEQDHPLWVCQTQVG